jgi:stage V sporulation protein D (sporulation-specific penicillin-binding protein)
MSETDAATNSFGQNINVTMIQMGAAFCSLINGGNYYQPHMLKRIEKESGEVVKSFDATLVKQTVTSSTSQLLRKYLKSTVDSGLAVKAGVTGYSIGGKTGTAQKGTRSDLKWIISFIGFAPVDDPQVMVYVVIDEPYGTTGTSGSSTDVLTLSHDILEELLPYMNIFKDSEAEAVDTTNAADEGTVQINIDNN